MTLSVTVTDDHEATVGESFVVDVQIVHGDGSAWVTIEINTHPEVEGIVPSVGRIDVDDGVSLDLTAGDNDGDPLSCEWRAIDV